MTEQPDSSARVASGNRRLEIAWGGFLTLEELSARLEQWPFCPDALEIYRRWRAGRY